MAGRDHAHRQPQHARGVGSAVDQVADEHHPPTVGVLRVDRAADIVAGEHVAEFGKQLLEFGAAAVDVADDVEGTGLVAHVVEQGLDDDVRHVDFRRGAQHVHLAESLPVQRPDRAPQVAALTPDDVVAEVAVGTPGIACRTE